MSARSCAGACSARGAQGTSQASATVAPATAQAWATSLHRAPAVPSTALRHESEHAMQGQQKCGVAHLALLAACDLHNDAVARRVLAVHAPYLRHGLVKAQLDDLPVDFLRPVTHAPQARRPACCDIPKRRDRAGRWQAAVSVAGRTSAEAVATSGCSHLSRVRRLGLTS